MIRDGLKMLQSALIMGPKVLLASWLPVMLFYRASIGLPHLACGQGRIPWRQSWNVTQSLTGQIAIATAAGLGGLMALDVLCTPIYEHLPMLGTLIDTVLEVIIILVGASLMNVIYQNSGILQKD